MPGPSSADVVATTSFQPYKPVFGTKKPASANVKVVRAHLSRSSNGKPKFAKLGQAFVDVTDVTANVYYITRVIQKWGEEYVLVTADGLRIDDSLGTQGIIEKCHNYYIIF